MYFLTVFLTRQGFLTSVLIQLYLALLPLSGAKMQRQTSASQYRWNLMGHGLIALWRDLRCLLVQPPHHTLLSDRGKLYCVAVRWYFKVGTEVGLTSCCAVWIL